MLLPFVKGAVALCLAQLDKWIYLVYEVKAKRKTIHVNKHVYKAEPGVATHVNKHVDIHDGKEEKYKRV